jgi:hypothetical protein
MIGRQLCVVSHVLHCSTSLNVDVDAGEETLWGVSVAWQSSSTPVSSVRSSHTIVVYRMAACWHRPSYRFLSSNPLPTSSYASVSFGSYWYALGPGFSLVNKTIAGYQRDEVYIGTAEERAAKDHADDDEQLHMGPGHPRKAPGFTENYPLAEA